MAVCAMTENTIGSLRQQFLAAIFPATYKKEVKSVCFIMKSKDHQRKRKRRELLDFKAYESMTIKSRPSMGRPGSPHRFFASSYHVTTVPGEIETSNDDSNANTASKQSYSSQGQIVHR
jgi:hypothetical protein